jgi:hypothetical protein
MERRFWHLNKKNKKKFRLGHYLEVFFAEIFFLRMLSMRKQFFGGKLKQKFIFLSGYF